eukprot:TRINITY_DN95494_c0_g1_i1.p1 TRINITY_DN95494_c0_g1~~TRINITY_DN95494_c0_g1_i1.p1  ORF type:complete len:245 (-),score=43.65 TRINITY_DN95494_c0_g1_i1:43-744(-)
MDSHLLSLCFVMLVMRAAASLSEAMVADDECEAERTCSLNALQLQSTSSGEATWGYMYPPAPSYGYGRSGYSAAGGAGWSQIGDKMFGSGAGMETINSGNVDYYNQGMYAAAARCGGAGCALITNPAGHRSIDTFHIHFVHFASYGANLKRKLEQRVCGKGGWHGGGLPCGGKAAFFSGFPKVFSVAMGGANIHHASVIAWPASCGGTGTIVELAFGCSIEHQIRGDYNPSRR